jgi:hypothetical protein
MPKKSRSRLYAACLFLATVSVAMNPSHAQERSTPTATDKPTQSVDAHLGDFDYLLGDWEFTADNNQYGKMHGYWSAARLEAGKQILDEYRIVGTKGETYYLTTTIRAYNSALQQWELVSMDQGTGMQNFGTGHRDGTEMHIEQKFAGPNGTTSSLRIRYYNIGPKSFSWAADRSTDGGKTWTKDFQRLEAHRIGPPRTLSSLTSASGTTPQH